MAKAEIVNDYNEKQVLTYASLVAFRANVSGTYAKIGTRLTQPCSVGVLARSALSAARGEG